MGVVYRARDPALGRRVALKLLAPELARDERFRKRFLRETKLAASIEHPHVLPVYAAGEAEGVLYLAARYVEGEDLRAVLARDGPLAPEHVLAVAGPLADALDCAHAAGLVHRDVKPANVLLDLAGRPYLADFGLAKPASADRSLTGAGEFLGTIEYVAPEQVRDDPVDGRADQYSLACLLFECLSGRVPFERTSPLAALWAQVQDLPPRLSEVRPELPTTLDSVLDRALAKDPESRYVDCAELVEALAAALRSEHPSAAAVRRPGKAARDFVGRERELAELEAALADAFAGHGRLVLLAGEPGIGKSRLAEELAARAVRRGADVLVGRCWEAGGAPAYWPWVQALRPLVADAAPDALREQLGSGAGYVAHLLPDVQAVLPDLDVLPSRDSQHARFQLFDAAARFLRSAALARPVVIVLDDLHAADEPSLLLLRFVARELGGARLLLVGAYRDVDPVVQEPLASSVAELAREPAVSHLRLGGLDRAGVADYIERSAGRSPAGALVTAIHSTTEGNPLFVSELVRLLEAEGGLELPEGAAPEVRVPPGVRDVIRSRLGRLPPESGRALATASVLGREFGFEALEQVSDLAGETLLEALDAATAAAILVDVPRAPGRLRFGHGLIREVLYEGLGPARRARLHGRVAAALEELYAADVEPHLAELAHHYAASGNTASAVAYARRAGDRAGQQLAYEEAVRLYRAALAAAQDASEGAHVETDLRLALGDALAKAGDMATARETFLQAAKRAREARLADRLARAALGYGGRFVWGLAEDDRLVPLLEEALVALDRRDGALRARLLARLGGALRVASPQRSASVTLEAVEEARRCGDHAALASALVSRRVALWGPDNLEELFALSNEIIELVEAAGDRELAVSAHTLLLELHLTRGDIAGVRAELDAARRLAEELRVPAHTWHVAVHETELALLEGRFDEAEELVEQAYGLREQCDPAQVEQCAVAQRVAFLREQGRLEEIRRSLEELSSDAYPIFACLLADAECGLGRPDRARTILASLARERFAGIPRDSDWLLAMGTLAEVAVSLGDLEGAATLYELLSPYAELTMGAAHRFTVGSAARHLGLLAGALSRLEDTIRHFEDALAANERLGARPWLAHTQHDYARALLERDLPGDREHARDLLAHCLATCRDLGMPVLEAKAASLAA